MKRHHFNGDWGRVPGRSVLEHPLYTAAVWATSSLIYGLLERPAGASLPAYAEIAPGRISRSGRPNEVGWRLLRRMGVRSVINLRLWPDRVPKLRDLGFAAYLHLPIPDGLPPTEAQAMAFLEFVTSPRHWPAHIHCLAGLQRSAMMAALARYAVQGFPMEEAIMQASSGMAGPTRRQKRWLMGWTRRHPGAEWPWQPAA